MIGAHITYVAPIGRKIRGFSAVLKRLLQDVVIFWHRNFLPHHFDTPAKVNTRYPGVYSPRTKKHMIRKARILGHQRLLDWTGRTRAEMLRSIRVSGTSKSAKGVMTGANRALNFGGRAGMPDMRKEITTVNQEEAEVGARIVDQGLTDFLNSQKDEVAATTQGESAGVAPPGREVFTGRRGGRYYKNDANKRVYLRKG